MSNRKGHCTRAKLPAANWLFTIQPRLERQEVSLGTMTFRSHQHPRYLAGYLTTSRPFWSPTASFITWRPLDFTSAIIPNTEMNKKQFRGTSAISFTRILKLRVPGGQVRYLPVIPVSQVQGQPQLSSRELASQSDSARAYLKISKQGLWRDGSTCKCVGNCSYRGLLQSVASTHIAYHNCL